MVEDLLRCQLCREPAESSMVRPVVVAARTTREGEIVFRQGELWCEGCATLSHGLALFRHVTLPKEAR